jgi:hypothetical protein
MNPDTLRRAICCPGGTCVRPEACDRNNRNVVVNVPLAATAVAQLLCEGWRQREATHLPDAEERHRMRVAMEALR